MPAVIEYCIGNVSDSTRSRLESLPGEAVEKPCLERCGRCFTGSLLVVDGTPTYAETMNELIKDVGEEE